jgi:ABC-type polysaccharide/polyol phosphate export permease
MGRPASSAADSSSGATRSRYRRHDVKRSEPLQYVSTLTRFDPLYYLVDATRAGLTGFHESSTWISLIVAAGIALAAFAAAAALLFARAWRLKP